MFKKLFKYFRLSFLIVVFVLLLVPFMFFSVVNKGVKKAKNILGFKKSDGDQSFFDDVDSQAWADVPGEPGGPPKTDKCILLSYKGQSESFTEFTAIVPRTEKSLSFVDIPKEAMLADGSIELELNWNRNHQLVSVGLIEQESPLECNNIKECALVSAIYNNDGKNLAESLNKKDLNYLHTIQGDNVGLIFGDGLKLRIEEKDPEESFIDQIKVFEIEHGKNEEVVVANDFKNFNILPKNKIKNTLLPASVSIIGKPADVQKIFRKSFSDESSGINLNYGQYANIGFKNLNPKSSYSLVAITRIRGWSPAAQTVFQIIPKPMRLALKFVFLGAVGLVSYKLWGKLGMPLPFFILGNGSTPYLSVWDGKKYVLENDIMFSSSYNNYDPDFITARNRHESGMCAPDLYCIKHYQKELGSGRVVSYLVSASGFYTDLRLQNQKLFRNLIWLFKK